MWFLIFIGALILGTLVYLVRSFYIFLWAKANQPAFELVEASNAMYIRKRNGQMRKIADHKFTAEEYKKFHALAVRAQSEVERENH